MSNDSLFEFDSALAISNIARSLKVGDDQIAKAIELLDSGNTIPFIARYRKEATRGLDEIALRAIEDAIERARELFSRKLTVLKTIRDQGLLTEDLHTQIVQCLDLATLEAIYLPFKPRRRTRATIAREHGLQPLADLLLAQTPLRKSRQEILRPFVNVPQDVPDEESALRGALDIVAEIWSDDAGTRLWLAQHAQADGQLFSRVKRGMKDDAEKYAMYVDHRESVARAPSHRFLAMKRGEQEGVLRVSIEVDTDSIVAQLRSRFVHNTQFEFHRELLMAVQDCFERLLMPATESTVMQTLKDRSDEEAIGVFARNLRELLLAPPAGRKVTLGIDPGFRSGCKLAVVDGTGKFLANATIYPTPPSSDTSGASRTLIELIQRHHIELIAIGNGTASRETDAFVTDALRTASLKLTKVIVSESGASIYSASELAAKEYPDLDVTVRGAISIAHRLQDPLAELVKSDPKSIGVGQYQHDVNQNLLKRCLQREVESCVNTVGVDVNTASASLLSYVSGIGPKLAESIVRARDDRGGFTSRQQLAKVPKLGAKAFQQSAGFLRVDGGDQPLDNSAVHPEAYGVVVRMAKQLGVPIHSLVGNATLSQKLRPGDFVNEEIGLPTIIDIIEELAKPGRDPRREFRSVQFSDEVQSIEDVKPGMVLEGVITNVTHFGAFVDLGVHHDALIHISQLSKTFVKDPSEVVAVGNVVKVKVLDVDLARKRISATRKF